MLREALDYEHRLYESVMTNFHTIKTRRAAGKNFEKWIIKKMSDLKKELDALKVISGSPLRIKNDLMKVMQKSLSVPAFNFLSRNEQSKDLPGKMMKT